MENTGFLFFAGVLISILIFAASMLAMSFLLDFLSAGKFRWVVFPVIAAAVSALFFAPHLPVSVLESLTQKLTLRSIAQTVSGGLVMGGLFSGV